MRSQSSSIGRYLQSIAETALLTAEQEMWLSIQVHAKEQQQESKAKVMLPGKARPGHVRMAVLLANYDRCRRESEQLQARTDLELKPAPDFGRVVDEVRQLRISWNRQGSSYIRSCVAVLGWQTPDAAALFSFVACLYLLPKDWLLWLQGQWQDKHALPSCSEFEQFAKHSCDERRLLQNDEEIVEAAEQARDQMIRANLRLVVHVAKRCRTNALPMLDVLQEGNIGLMHAVEKYDHTLGYKFATYATWWIRQAINRAASDQARIIRLPVHVEESLARLCQEQARYRQENGALPTVEELVLIMDFLAPDEADQIKQALRDGRPVDPHLVRRWNRAIVETQRLLQSSETVLSLDVPVTDEDDGAVLQDFIADEQAIDPAQHAANVNLRESVVELLDTLSQREKEIIEMRHGLDGREPQTLEQAGAQIGVTRERVRQIEAKAFRKLRYSARIRQRDLSPAGA